MRIQAFRMFKPPPTPQFRGLKCQKPAVCYQAWRGPLTFSRLLGHQIPSDSSHKQAHLALASLASALLLSAHSPRLTCPEPLTWTESSAPHGHQRSAPASTAKSTSAHSRLVSAPKRHFAAPCSSQSESDSLADMRK